MGHLYIRNEDWQGKQDLLEATLGNLLRNPEIDSQGKCEVIRQVGVAMTRDLLKGEEEIVGLDRAVRFLDEVISWVLSDPEAVSRMVQMSGHHQNTASHMFVVSILAVLLGAEAYGPDPRRLRELGLAGLLHDAGKLRISPGVLSKTEPLTAGELQMIRQHPIESVRLIGNGPEATAAVRQIIVQHHERVDGGGYPVGLRGDDILPGARVLSIVDTFHALVGRRCYGGAMKPEAANRILAAQAGRQFDPFVLACWESLFQRCPLPEAVEAGEESGEPEPDSWANEHRLERLQKVVADRPARLRCNGRLAIRCVYAGRIRNLTSAPDVFNSPLHDLSRSGMCLHTEHPMYRGEVVHLRVEQGGTCVWLEGRVAWSRRQFSGSMYRTGIQFEQRLSESNVGRTSPGRRIDSGGCPPVETITPTAAAC